MERFFEGGTEVAGNSKSGIRWSIAEKLCRGGSLVFGWYRDHDELANELYHMAQGTRIIDVTPSVSASFERWFVAPGTRTVFLARGSEVDVPLELMEDALAALANVAATRINEKTGRRQNRPFSEKSLAAFLIRPLR